MREEMREIIPPTNCPSCSEALVWEKDQLFCHNTKCSGKTSKKIEHFASTLKIKGLGPKTVAKLQIIDYFDLYEMPLETMIDALQSEKLGVKLYREIQASKSVDLVQLLPAFSIKLIGRTASAKLCSVINTINDIDEQVCVEAGLGPTATQNLLDWFYEEYTDGLDRLPFSWKTTVQQKTEIIQGIVCISGKLKAIRQRRPQPKY